MKKIFNNLKEKAWFRRWKALSKTMTVFFCILVCATVFDGNFEYIPIMPIAWFWLCILNPIPFAIISWRKGGSLNSLCAVLEQKWDDFGEIVSRIKTKRS